MPAEGRDRRDNPVVEISPQGEALVVRLAGELDLYNAPSVRNALLGAIDGRHERVIVDLAEVDFMDSTALGALVEVRASLARRESLILAAPGLEARRVLEISGLDRYFTVHETVEEALAADL